MNDKKAEHPALSLIRRGTLGIGAVTLLSALGRIGRKVHPHTVETEDATFVMLMGTHGIGTFGQEVEYPKELKDVDAAFLETGNIPYLDKEKNTVKLPDRFEKMAFYRKFIPVLRKRNIPILFGDLPTPALSSMLTVLSLGAVSLLAIQGGATLAFGRDTKKSSGIKKTLGIATMLWGFSEILKQAVTTIPEFSRAEDNKAVRKASFWIELSHPENMIVVLRNAVIAEKLLAYAQNFKKEHGRKPTILLVMGAGHELISEYLQKGREFCKKLIRLYPQPFLRKLYGEYYPAYFPILAEVSGSDTSLKTTLHRSFSVT